MQISESQTRAKPVRAGEAPTRRTLAAIAGDLHRLLDDLVGVPRGEDPTVAMALEDAKWALCRARIAVREAELAGGTGSSRSLADEGHWRGV